MSQVRLMNKAQLILTETIVAYKRGQMIEARESCRMLFHKLPIPTPRISPDLVKVEEILSGYAPRYKTIRLAKQRKPETLYEIVCEVCGSTIIASKLRRYCGHQSIKGSCAYKVQLKKSNEYHKKIK